PVLRPPCSAGGRRRRISGRIPRRWPARSIEASSPAADTGGRSNRRRPCRSGGRVASRLRRAPGRGPRPEGLHIRTVAGAISAYGLTGDRFLDLSRLSRQRAAEEPRASFGDEHDILDTYAEILRGDVNSRLDGDHHARFERRILVGRIVHFETQM